MYGWNSTAPWTATALITFDKVTYLELPATTPRDNPHNESIKCVKDLAFPIDHTPDRTVIKNNRESEPVGRNVQLQTRKADPSHLSHPDSINDVESATGAIYSRKQTRIQQSGMFTRWYESVGDEPITCPPVIRPCKEPIAVGDLFVHKYRAVEDGVQKDFDQIWVLKRDTERDDKLRWHFIPNDDKNTTHHPDPRLKDRILSVTKQLGHPSWVSPATLERSKFHNS